MSLVQLLERRYYNNAGEPVSDWIPVACTNWELGAKIGGRTPYQDSLDKGIRECGCYVYAPGRGAYRCEERMAMYERVEEGE